MALLALLLWLQLLLLLLELGAVRQRLAKLVLLSRAGETTAPVEGDLESFELICSEGVDVPADVLRLALIYARQAGLAVLDLIPNDLPALDLFAYLQLLDVGAVRQRPFEVGRSVGLALLVAKDVLGRVRLDGARSSKNRTPAALIRLAKRLKRYAPYSYGMALCQGIGCGPWRRLGSSGAVLEAHLGPFALQALLSPLLVLALVASGWHWGHSWLAGFVLLTYQLQPLVALGLPGDCERTCPGGLRLLLLCRLPLAICRSARAAVDLLCRANDDDKIDGGTASSTELADRASYAEELAKGTQRFFEPRRKACPLCAHEKYAEILSSPDHMQHKPGRFYLSQCGSCGHVFQNPQLTPEGLSFYYRDAYEGRSTEAVEWMFDIQEARYVARAKMLLGRPGRAPERWLDVGGGHGHFCCAARQQWPNTRFELVDCSEAVEEAARRGWADRTYRGQFLNILSDLEGLFDVVSMSHYLEHTSEPWRELAAARSILREGGHLLIELPDPECRLGVWMGSLWQSWLQPQHLHLPPIGALETLLRQHGFEAVARQRQEAHIRSDVTFFMAKAMNQLLLSPDLSRAPWQPRESSWRDLVRCLAWWVPGSVMLLLGWAIDALGGSLLLRLAGSNTYRVLAVRSPESAPSK